MTTLNALHHAQREAERCLQCHDAPCTAACPAHIDVPGFIRSIRSGNVSGAAETVRSANALANVCGAVCPQEIFCQAVCTRAKQDEPVAIRELHGFATREQTRRGFLHPHISPEPGGRVAVIGAGPAGLACAFHLATLGHRVALYDRQAPGGVPRTSIPAFRLRADELQGDVAFLSRFVDFTGEHVDTRSITRLREEHDALFVAVGLGADKPLGLPGENLPGVEPVLQFLERAKANPDTPSPGTRVIVVGGGNVSLDAAATAKRLGASEVALIYRRGEQEMRVWTSELNEARRQGVQIAFLTTPVEIAGTARVTGVRCRRTRLSEKLDADGRRIPTDIPGSEFTMEADAVIVAIGQTPAADFMQLFTRTPRGYISVDAEFHTSLPSVFAGGDVTGGEGTIVQSVAQGKQAAQSIHRHIAAGTRGGKA
jgi:dihydropyrimidine dehydrogenase (NAD+) subunit PreT